MASRRNVKYSRLVDGADNRFEYMPKSLDKVPRKSILLALFLLSLGCLLLVLSVSFSLIIWKARDHKLTARLLLELLPSFQDFMRLGLPIILGGVLQVIILLQSLTTKFINLTLCCPLRFSYS